MELKGPIKINMSYEHSIEDENIPNIHCPKCNYKLIFEEGSHGYCEQCGKYQNQWTDKELE